MTIGLKLFVVFIITIICISNYINSYKELRKRVNLIFYSSIQIFYIILGPLVQVFSENYLVFNSMLSGSEFLTGTFAIFLHILFFHLGYGLISIGFRSKRQVIDNPFFYSFTNRTIRFFYILVLSLLVLNFFTGDINLYRMIFSEEIGNETLGFSGNTNWLASLADTLVVVLLALFFSRISMIEKVAISLLSIFLFLILGFRYRLILLMLGIVLLYISKVRLDLKKLRVVFGFMLIGFSLLLFWTENRIQFYSGDFEKVNYNLATYNYSNILENLQGGNVDIALVSKLSSGDLHYDFGKSMFIYPVIMAMPSGFFKDGVKPYPAPQISNLDKSIRVDRSYGQACTFVGMAFNAFSWIGVVVLSLFFGLVAALWEPVFLSERARVIAIVFLIASFQLYTRGFLGLFLIPFVFMILPVLFCMKINSIRFRL